MDDTTGSQGPPPSDLSLGPRSRLVSLLERKVSYTALKDTTHLV